MHTILCFLCFIGLILASFSVRAQNIEAGKKVFRKCIACHMVGTGAKHRIGPHLNNMIGRKVAGEQNYRYSRGMIEYAKIQEMWDMAALDVYLTNPRRAVAGTRMSFAGLRKKQDRDDVLAYIDQFKP